MRRTRASLLDPRGGRGRPRPLPATAAPRPAVIAYVFPRDRVLDPLEIRAEKLTHVNFAFANVVGGRVVEGSPHDAENLKVLTGLRRDHPHLRILISVGGWTGRRGSRTPRSPRRAAASSSRAPSTS